MVPIISVIVPFYQAEKTLDTAIQSVIKQSFQDWELILVDDGSTDAGLQVAKSWLDRDARITLLHQENKGRSAARNAGIEKAQGDWITFLDADDQLIGTALEQLFNATSDQTDLVCGHYQKKDGCQKLDPITSCSAETFYKVILNPYSGSAYKDSPLFNGIFERVVWGKLYKSQIIKDANVCFKDGLKFGEDALFNLAFSLASNREILLLKNAIYIYDLSMPGTTRGFSYKDLQALQAFIAASMEELDAHVESGAITRSDEYTFISMEVMAMFRRMVRYSDDQKQDAHYFDLFMQDPTAREIARYFRCPTYIGTQINRFYLFLMKHRKTYLASKLAKLLPS